MFSGLRFFYHTMKGSLILVKAGADTVRLSSPCILLRFHMKLISTNRQHHVSELIDGFSSAETHQPALKTFILAMVMYPEIQKLAQQEIDSLLHGERLPDFDDMISLPYVTALVTEVQRWHPVTPTSVPFGTRDPKVMYGLEFLISVCLSSAVARTTTEDDFFMGYFIPKGSLIIPNTWEVDHITQTSSIDVFLGQCPAIGKFIPTIQTCSIHRDFWIHLGRLIHGR
jgi:hypothetical protein